MQSNESSLVEVWLTKQVSLRALLKVMKLVKLHISFNVILQGELLNQAFLSKFLQKKSALERNTLFSVQFYQFRHF